MFENFDARNNEKQEDDEDSETLSYSYPSYSRFTYTGKTKSRLGRSRFMRQTGGKEETKISDNSTSSGISELKPSHNFLQSNSQAPKTPGVGWLQRESSIPAHPFTPGGNSKAAQGNSSELNRLPSQSNFLFNLKNDSVQNSSCKRNLPFSTTPFKSKDVPSEDHGNVNPLRELNQLLKPENPFSKLDFFGRSKEENKENSDKTKSEKAKISDLDPSWNQLKKICDAAVPYPAVSANVPETNQGINTSDQLDFLKTGESSRPSIFAPPSGTIERRDEKNKDDDSANMPLDLSSAESTSRSLFSGSLMSGCDQLDSDSSSSLNRQIKDVQKESVGRSDDSTIQKTNTDALSGFLPKFLIPKNKSNQTDLTDSDVSAHSVGTVVERIFDFQPQVPFLTPHGSTKTLVTSSDAIGTSCEVNSSSQCMSKFHNDMKKTSPPSLPINFLYNEPNPHPVTFPNSKDQSSSQHNSDKKHSPPTMLENITPLDPPKLSPPSAQSIPDLKDLVIDGQHFLKKEENLSVVNNGPSMKGGQEINSLASNIDTNPVMVSKSSASLKVAHKSVPDIYNGQIRNTNVSLNSASEIRGDNQCNIDIKPPETLIKPTASIQQKIPLGNQIQRSNEPLNSIYRSGIQHQTKPPVLLESGEKNLCQAPLQQASVAKPALIDQRDPSMYSRPPETIQSSLNQKTYLAPQQPSDRNNAGNFPHVKPEIPQMVNSKPSFPAMKKPNQFRMSAPRGMPSRADTELSVNGKSYAILSMLGKGGSSEVYQVLDSTSSKLLAVKCVDLSMVDKTIADGYLNEIDLLSRLQGCASVIRMFDYEYVQEGKMLYVVMEKGDTDLSHLIRDISKTKKISMSMIIYYWTEMLQAVKDIHDQGIIHSDLKPANFLLVSGRLKLIDFGIASSQGDMTSVVKEVTTGTWNYMSPEAIKNSNASGKGFKITYKSDVWSLGCILYNLVYGKTPFSHITNTWGKLTAIADPNHCIEFPDVGAPAVLAKALRSCFHREPKLRPTVAELLCLPYHSTGDGGAPSELSSVGRQVQALLPTQWWLRVAHLFPEVKSNSEGRTNENAG